MKKIVKYIVLTVTLFILNISIAVHADESIATHNINIKVYSDYSSVYNGKTYIFNNHNDKATFEMFYNKKSSGNQVAENYNPIRVRQKFIRKVKLGRKWVNYNPLTPNWQKASSYNVGVNTSITVTGSFTYNGTKFGVGASLSKGVRINIPADRKRESRLGFEVDVEMHEYVLELYDTSQKNKVVNRIPSKYPVIINTYNVVKYK